MIKKHKRYSEHQPQGIIPLKWLFQLEQLCRHPEGAVSMEVTDSFSVGFHPEHKNQWYKATQLALTGTGDII